MEIIVSLAMMLLIGWWVSRYEDRERDSKESEIKKARESDPFYDSGRLLAELLRWMSATEKPRRADDVSNPGDRFLKTGMLAGFSDVLILHDNPFCISIHAMYHNKTNDKFANMSMEIFCDNLTTLNSDSSDEELEVCVYFHDAPYVELMETHASIEKLGIGRALSLNLTRIPIQDWMDYYTFPPSIIRDVLRETNPKRRLFRLTQLIENTCLKIDSEFRRLGFVSVSKWIKAPLHSIPNHGKLPQ